MTFICARTGRQIVTEDRRRRWCCKWCQQAARWVRQQAAHRERLRFGAAWSHEAAALRTGAGR
jgi:hypothetical protein